MSKIKHAKFYANQDVFSTMRSVDERRTPVLQRDMEKNALKSVEWFTYGPLTWAQVRDEHARCLTMPKGFFYMGPTHKRNCVEIKTSGAGHIKQWKSVYGTIRGHVTAVNGAPGTLASRSSFFADIGIALPNLSNTNSKFRLVFQNGDLAGVGRNVVSYDQVTGLITLYDPAHPGGQQKGDPVPGWDGRLIRVGDAFVIRMMHSATTGSPECSCLYESCSRVYRDPWHDNSPSVFKSIKFKYSNHWAPGVRDNLIGDDPNVPGINHPIADGQNLYLRWKEITYLIEPTLVPVMPSTLFPSLVNLSLRKGLWPPQQQFGAVTSVTPVLIGNYTPPGHWSTPCPVYIWEIDYGGGTFRRYEFPVFYRALGIPRGFHLEMWHQKTRKNGPWPSRGCNPLRSSGGNKATIKVGEWIYMKQTHMMGMPLAPRNPIVRHDSFRIRFRNWKDGGLSLPSRQKVSLKYRQIKGYVWNIPFLEE